MSEPKKKTYIWRDIITSDSGVSSKRVAGLLGWVVGLLICIWSAAWKQDAPAIVDTLFICSTTLIGADVVRDIVPQKRRRDE